MNRLRSRKAGSALREVFSMWKYTKMIVLVAVSAAFYAALTIPLKILTFIPGFTEFRPGAVVPVVFGLLFGPAGAWGAAFGNVIGDFFGTFGIGTVFGFFGNFFYGFLGYKVWAHMGLAESNEDLKINSGKKVLNFVLVAALSSMACGLIIASGLDAVKVLPFVPIAPVIALNNTLACLILGIPLMGLLFKRLNRWDLVWFAIMDERDITRGLSPKTGTLLIWVGVVGGLASGTAVSTGAATGLMSGLSSSAFSPVALVVAPFLVLLLIGSLII